MRCQLVLAVAAVALLPAACSSDRPAAKYVLGADFIEAPGGVRFEVGVSACSSVNIPNLDVTCDDGGLLIGFATSLYADGDSFALASGIRFDDNQSRLLQIHPDAQLIGRREPGESFGTVSEWIVDGLCVRENEKYGVFLVYTAPCSFDSH